MSTTAGNTVTCAAPGCNGPITRGGRGRPRIYCTPACRPNALRHADARDSLTVVVDHEPVPEHTRPTGRIWKVQLQRAGRTVIIATGLGRPSADHLANQIDALLNPRQQAHGAAID